MSGRRSERAIILAAGKGERLLPITAHRPKPRPPVNGTPILRNCVQMLGTSGIMRATIVVGHLGNLIREELGSELAGVEIEYVPINDYLQTNNIVSLWAARDRLCNDVIIIEGDVFFDRGIFDRMLESDLINAVAVDRMQEHMTGAAVSVDDQWRIQELVIVSESGEISKQELWKTINIHRFGREFMVRNFLPEIERTIRAGITDEFYECALARVIARGEAVLRGVPCPGVRWMEIDDPSDYAAAQVLFLDNRLEETRGAITHDSITPSRANPVQGSPHGGQDLFVEEPFEYLGVRPFINCAGVRAINGNCRMLPEVEQVMAAAANRFVNLDDLMLAVGERLSMLMGAEWGIVTAGSAAAVALSAAACVAGNDPEKMVRLPILAQNGPIALVPSDQRFAYEQALRVAGLAVRSVTSATDVERALTQHDVALICVNAMRERGSQLPLGSLVPLAQRAKIPDLVDAASVYPESPDPWLGRGADLVVYSGGKFLRGPHSTGLLVGRRELVEAAWLERCAAPVTGPTDEGRKGRNRRSTRCS
ncbi:aminotransferase class V-fold PLP-dependent enzyme [Bradyrhizobium sp. BR 1432]|uniref:aminotransferase class V-fold PLP-dependent enzyme n=1 Tax=Bradyrhizobium sp. BR 1432 TaxID=3447966 RepID=UPI003EE599BA